MTEQLTFVVTGGTGSFGSAMTAHLLNNTSHHVRILSRDEHKQERMMAVFPPNERTTFILADIRDRERLDIAFHRADVVIHAAAYKTVPAGERNVEEFIKTNVLGSINVVKASIANHVPKTLLVSSDKAVSSINLYGKTKGIAESVFVAANAYGHGAKFASVRGGNVWNSRGSVLDKWLVSDPILVTDPSATRFHLPMDYWLSFCLQAIDNMHGGEIFVPKCEAWSLDSLSKAFCEVYRDKSLLVSERRPGDKIHETLLSKDESINSLDLGWGYVIQPSEDIRSVWSYEPHQGKKLNGSIESNRARQLTIDELRTLISSTF